MDDETMAAWEHEGACGQARGRLEQCAVDVAVGAVTNLRPARIRAARRTCAIARSRRQREQGHLLVGVADPEMDALLDVVSVTTDTDESIATIVVYGCHPTVLAWESLLFSPDYVGALRRVVEMEYGAPCLFLQGCGADRGPTRSFSNVVEDADAVGRAIGYAAVAAALEAEELSLEVHFRRMLPSGAPLAINEILPPEALPASVRCAQAEIALPLRPRDAEATRVRVERAHENVKRGIADASVELARALIQDSIVQRFPAGAEARVPVDLLAVGPIAFVFWPGELSGAYESLIQKVTSQHIIVVTNANDYVNYLPTPEQFSEGGYEVESSPFAPTAGDALVHSLAAFLQSDLAGTALAAKAVGVDHAAHRSSPLT